MLTPNAQAVNPNLAGLYEDLSALHSQGKLDAFGLYIFGYLSGTSE